MVVWRQALWNPFLRFRLSRRHRPLLLVAFCCLVFGTVFLLQRRSQPTPLAELSRRRAEDLARRLSIAHGHKLGSGHSILVRRPKRPSHLGHKAFDSNLHTLRFANEKEELAALIAFVTATTANSLPALDPSAVLDPTSILDFDPTAPDASDNLKVLVDEIYALHPLIVFGKMRDPWHLGLKRLFESLGVAPAPLIIDVDRRRDHQTFVPLLSRLFGTDELPQVILRGRVIGSYPEVLEETRSHALIARLEAAGLTVAHRQRGKGAKEWERLENERILRPGPIVE